MNENLKNIDEKLGSAPQQAVARMVGGLPEETPSMLWRSGLNEALRAQARKTERRRRIFWLMRPVSLTAACALAAVLFIHPASMPQVGVSHPAPKVVRSGIEGDLVDLHQNDVRAFDVAGSGLNPTEAVSNSSGSTANVSDDSEADLEL